MENFIFSAVFCQNENFVNTSKKFLKSRNWAFLVVHYFTWKLEFGSYFLSMIVNDHIVSAMTVASCHEY